MDVLVYGSARVQSLANMCIRGLDGLKHDTAFFNRAYPHRKVSRAVSRVPGGEVVLDEVIRRAFLSQVASFDPDLLLVIKGYGLESSVLKTVRERSDAVAVNWNPDNPFQMRAERTRAEKYLDALESYDIVYTWGEFLVDDLQTEGAMDVRVLPFAHDPSLHYPADPTARYDCGVSFVGHWSEKRERLLGALTAFDLQVRGPGWEEECTNTTLMSHVEGGPLRGEEYTQAMSSADLIVNVLADHNVPGHNMRTFEAPASGSLMLTTRTQEQQRFFEDCREVVMYDTADELCEAVARYLDRPDEREAIADAGLTTVQPHTYERRMERLIEEAEEYL